MSNTQEGTASTTPTPQEKLSDAIDEALRAFYAESHELAPTRSVTVTFGFTNDRDLHNTQMGVITVVSPPLRDALGRFVYAIVSKNPEAPEAPPSKVTLT